MPALVTCRRIGLGLVCGVFVLALCPSAGAYCRTMTCDPMNPEDVCQFDKHSCVVTGRPLFWPGGNIEVWADSAGSMTRGVTGAQTVTLLKRAYAQWMSAQCENGDNPFLDVVVRGQVNNGVAEFDREPGAENINVVVYQDTEWPYASSAVAITTMTFDVNSGEIVDGDTEMNARDYVFAVEPTVAGEIDVQAVLTHEAGHVVGLAHTDVSGATMEAAAHGSAFTRLRTLEADDEAGVCEIYDPTEESASGCVCDIGRRRSERGMNGVFAIAVGVLLARYRRRAR